MAPKIKLGCRPKTFLHTVTIPVPEGGVASVQMAYRYRTRTEFAEFVDSLVKASGAAASASTDDQALDQNLRSAMERAIVEQSVDYILQIADGWNLDEDFNRANVLQLCDELPGAAIAIMTAYRAALTEGRLGN